MSCVYVICRLKTSKLDKYTKIVNVLEIRTARFSECDNCRLRGMDFYFKNIYVEENLFIADAKTDMNHDACVNCVRVINVECTLISDD